LETISILGTSISIIESYEEAYKSLKQIFKTSSFVTVNNVHTVVLGVRNGRYRGALNDSAMSVPDGKPLSVVARLKGEKKITRIFGPTFMEKVIEWGQEDGLKHFFFGSSNRTLDRMLNNIKAKYPRALVVGSYSPPYKGVFNDEENQFFLGLMNKSGADVFWIGLGAPKQEMWMYENYRKLNRGVMIGIGAGFDYLAGKTKHAPEWMKNFALEWLYRLIQEPGRLWKRYLITNSLFIWYASLELTGLRRFD